MHEERHKLFGLNFQPGSYVYEEPKMADNDDLLAKPNSHLFP